MPEPRGLLVVRLTSVAIYNYIYRSLQNRRKPCVRMFFVASNDLHTPHEHSSHGHDHCAIHDRPDSPCHISRADELSSFVVVSIQISSVARSAWQMLWKCQRLGVCKSLFAILQQAESLNCSRNFLLKHTQMLRGLHEL